MLVGYNDEKLESLIRINKSNKLYNDMKSELEKYQKLTELAFTDKIDTIKRSVHYYTLTSIAPSAYRWLQIKDVVDKRKKSEDKDSFEYFVKQINDLLGAEVTITNIYQFGYDASAYIVKFSYNDTTFELTIPVVEKISKNNIDYLHEGKLYLGYEAQPSVFECIITSYDEKDIEEAFESFVGGNIDEC